MEDDLPFCVHPHPTLPFHSCSQKPQGSTADEVMGGMSHYVTVFLHCSPPTLGITSMDTVMGHWFFFFFLLQAHWAKGCNQACDHSNFALFWEIGLLLRFILFGFNTVVIFHGTRMWWWHGSTLPAELRMWNDTPSFYSTYIWYVSYPSHKIFFTFG